MLNEPSGFRSHPSNAGATFCPCTNVCCPLIPTTHTEIRANTPLTATNARRKARRAPVLMLLLRTRLVLLVRRFGLALRRARCGELLVLLFGQEREFRQGDEHIVDRAFA